MAFRLKDISVMNPNTFYGLRFMKIPKEFIDEVYKILYAIGFLQLRRPSFTHTNSRMWLKLGMSNGGIIGCLGIVQ